MEQRIVNFRLDDQGHWVAALACGHDQHVRHDPPWVVRPWVTTPAGRAAALGRSLQCRRCDTGDALSRDRTGNRAVDALEDNNANNPDTTIDRDGPLAFVPACW